MLGWDRRAREILIVVADTKLIGRIAQVAVYVRAFTFNYLSLRKTVTLSRV